MKKFEFYDIQGKLAGIVTENEDGLVAESAGDPEFKEFIEGMAELEEAKTVREVVKSGFSYMSIVEVPVTDAPTGEAL